MEVKNCLQKASSSYTPNSRSLISYFRIFFKKGMLINHWKLHFLFFRASYIVYCKSYTWDMENTSARGLWKKSENMWFLCYGKWLNWSFIHPVLLPFLYSCHQVAVRQHIRLACNFSHFSMKWEKKKGTEDTIEWIIKNQVVNVRMLRNYRKMSTDYT